MSGGASVDDALAYVTEHTGHGSFRHCCTYSTVATASLCCDLAGYWEVIPL